MSIIGDSKEEDREIFAALKRVKQNRRARYGVPCPVCQRRLPKANPKILLPQQVCMFAHPQERYKDPRPRITAEQEDELWREQGFEKVMAKG